MSDNEDVQLPIPSRTVVGAGAGDGGVGVVSGGGGGLLSGFGTGLSSRKVIDASKGFRNTGSRRLNFTSNGSKGRGGATDGSLTGGVGSGIGGSAKACTACGIQFTWRMRRHHCRACRKACCDPCSKERLMLAGGDSKRHRVCHPCLKAHLASGRTRADRVMALTSSTASSLQSSPRGSRNPSRDVSRNVSRDVSRHGPGTLHGLATYREDAEPSAEEELDGDAGGAGGGGGGGGGDGGMGVPSSFAASAAAERADSEDGGAGITAAAAENAAAAAAAMAAAWTGGSNGGNGSIGGGHSGGGAGGGGSVRSRMVSAEAAAAAATAAAAAAAAEQTEVFVATTSASPAPSPSAAAASAAVEPSAAPSYASYAAARAAGLIPAPASASSEAKNAAGQRLPDLAGNPGVVLALPLREDGYDGERAGARLSVPEELEEDDAPTEETGIGPRGGGVPVATAVAMGVRTLEGDAGAQGRPPLGLGVRADPASHQHKRPVQIAKDQNPLALPWFTGKHASPCSKCEDLWRVAWSAREDFLRDMQRAETGKDYQLVHSVGENLRLYAARNIFWGGQAIRLRIEAEVAVPLGFAMRWLASLTARGGVYYPYSDTVACDIVEADSGALSVACAHWPTQLSGARRCTVLRYVSEDGTPPPGLEAEAAASGRPKDPRPTIVFTTIDHPIMREWAQSGVDVEVFPSGLVLEEMESQAGAVTKVTGLIGWDNKGALQHMAKMTYMTERAERLEGLGQHLRAMERGYTEQSAEGPSKADSPRSSKKAPAIADSSSQQASRPGANGKAAAKGKMGAPASCPESPPTNFSPLPPAQDVDDVEDDEDFNRRRMTSKAAPLSPNRGRDLVGGNTAVGAGAGHVPGPEGTFIRRMSDSGHSTGSGGGGGLGGGSGDWALPLGNKRLPSPARAAELEAEVSFLNRKLSVRQSLEERLRMSEADKARLVTKLATAKADADRRVELLEHMVQEMSEKLALVEDQMMNTQRKLGDAEQRAMTAQRDLRLARDALRVQAELAQAAKDAASFSAALGLSPGTNARFPTSNHDLPLAASPALRAPPPVSWGSGPVPPGGVSGAGGVGNGDGKAGSWHGAEAGAGAGAGKATGKATGRGELLVGRTQEMGVRFAMDTLRYSEDEEVVVFMLHLVQGLRHEEEARLNPANGGKQGTKSAQAAPSSGPIVSESGIARVLFRPSVLSSSSGGREGQEDGLSQLACLLISRACENEEVANFLFWYLKLEAEADPKLRPMYTRVQVAFTEALSKKNATFAAALKAAEAYMAAIAEVHTAVKRQGGRAPKKTARLKLMLAEKRLHVVVDPSGKKGGKGSRGHANLRHIPLPLDPNTVVLGLRPSTAYTFPSAMSPCVVEFVLSDSVGQSFKGDDLLLEPSIEDGPSMVTDISAQDMQSWSGGRLPRQRSKSMGGSKLHVHVEAWETEDTTEESSDGGVKSALDVDEEEDEEFLDRRRISADVGSLSERDVYQTSDAVLRRRDLSEATVEDDSSAVSFRDARDAPAPRANSAQLARRYSEDEPPRTRTASGAEKNDRSSFARQASSDLTKMRLWEQMQVLGSASRDRGSYLAIFKHGEDVRQDQLAVHMVSLMDRQLKEAGLDLRLKSYRVLATGLTTGMIEFVPGSVPMSAVLAKHGNSVLEFLRHHNPDPGGPLSMKREALDNFTRSCAGSCVVTYLLGVGDRHLDNLMLLPEGVLFHIDFGYLFGKDPKLMPPPFRLTKEMVEAMGGTDAPHYTVFKSLCCQAYRHLRKSAHQYLNLLSLMAGAGIKDLSDDPASVLQLVQDRFKLDLSDEEADDHFLGLVSQSVTALAPRVLEVMHQIRVAAR